MCADARVTCSGGGWKEHQDGLGAPSTRRALQVALPAQLGMDPEDLQRIRCAVWGHAYSSYMTAGCSRKAPRPWEHVNQSALDGADTSGNCAGLKGLVQGWAKRMGVVAGV